MQNLIDFCTAALPWIAMGLWIAITMTTLALKKKDKKPYPILQTLSWIPFILFIIVAIMYYKAGEVFNGSSWLVIAIIAAALSPRPDDKDLMPQNKKQPPKKESFYKKYKR